MILMMDLVHHSPQSLSFTVHGKPGECILCRWSGSQIRVDAGTLDLRGIPEMGFCCAEQEVTIQYNLCNEPWLKYSMAAVADRGLKASQWTSARLRTEVLYLETHKQRYELSHVETAAAASPDAPPAVSQITAFYVCNLWFGMVNLGRRHDRVSMCVFLMIVLI